LLTFVICCGTFNRREDWPKRKLILMKKKLVLLVYTFSASLLCDKRRHYNPCYCHEETECLLLTAFYPTTIIDVILNLHIHIITLKCSDYMQNFVVARFVGTVTYSYASRPQVIRNNCFLWNFFSSFFASFSSSFFLLKRLMFLFWYFFTCVNLGRPQWELLMFLNFYSV
jgi:hypothetical protein